MPAGKVAIVKQVTIYVDPTTLPTRVFLEDGATGAALFTGQQTAGNPEWFGFYGAIVIEEGESIHFQVSAGPGDGADVYAGGYLLDLP